MLTFDIEIQIDEYPRRCMACDCPAANMTPFGYGEICNWCLADLWPQDDEDDEFTLIYRDEGGEG